jgi:hypothetical protein
VVGKIEFSFLIALNADWFSRSIDKLMTIIETVVLGIISGIFTAFFLYVVSLLFKSHLVPWYQKVSYKGVDVSGIWVAKLTSDNGIHGNLEMNINQNAHELTGEATIIQGKDIDKRAQVTILSMKGNIWEGFITLNKQSKDRTRLSYSTSLLQVLNGGIRLKGVYCYRSIQSDHIESLDIKWERKESSKS